MRSPFEQSRGERDHTVKDAPMKRGPRDAATHLRLGDSHMATKQLPVDAVHTVPIGPEPSLPVAPTAVVSNFQTSDRAE